MDVVWEIGQKLQFLCDLNTGTWCLESKMRIAIVIRTVYVRSYICWDVILKVSFLSLENYFASETVHVASFMFGTKWKTIFTSHLSFVKKIVKCHVCFCYRPQVSRDDRLYHHQHNNQHHHHHHHNHHANSGMYSSSRCHQKAPQKVASELSNGNCVGNGEKGCLRPAFALSDGCPSSSGKML